MIKYSESPWILRILPDAFAFGIGLGIAYFLNWETKDLVWSLWLCSLTLGYLTLFSAISGAAYIGFTKIRHPQFEKKSFWLNIFIAMFAGIFFLVFFSLHFGGFHAGHSVFLQLFFPVPGMPKEGFGEAFMNPPLLWMLVFQHLIGLYGVFLIPAIIAERRYVFHPLISAIKNVRPGASSNNFPITKNERNSGRKKDLLSDFMSRPYINVMRMHLLIFFFGFCHALKIDSFFVYAIVYAVYFFPWSEIRRLKKKASD